MAKILALVMLFNLEENADQTSRNLHLKELLCKPTKYQPPKFRVSSYSGSRDSRGQNMPLSRAVILRPSPVRVLMETVRLWKYVFFNYHVVLLQGA